MWQWWPAAAVCDWRTMWHPVWSIRNATACRWMVVLLARNACRTSRSLPARFNFAALYLIHFSPDCYSGIQYLTIFNVACVMEFRNVWSWRQEAGLVQPVYCTALQLCADMQTATSNVLTAACCCAADVSNDCMTILFKDKQYVAINVGNHLRTDTASHARSLECSWNANWCEQLWSISDSRVVRV